MDDILLVEDVYIVHAWLEASLSCKGEWVAQPRIEGPSICRHHAALRGMAVLVNVGVRYQLATGGEHPNGW